MTTETKDLINGPWTIKPTAVYETVVDREDRLVAFLSITEHPEAKTRGALIAAAPDMRVFELAVIEAAETCRDGDEFMAKVGPLIAIRKAALAKSTPK